MRRQLIQPNSILPPWIIPKKPEERPRIQPQLPLYEPLRRPETPVRRPPKEQRGYAEIKLF